MPYGAYIPSDPNGNAQTKDAYDSVEFTLTNGASDYDLDAQQATFKANVAEPMYVEIYTTQDISVKFNATTNHAVTINANTTRSFDRQIARNIYLTNASGSNSTVRVYAK